MMVSDFIDHTSASWREEKVDEFFLPMDSEVIRKIPLSMRVQEHFWAWHFEKNGVFSVRSGIECWSQLRTLERTGWIAVRLLQVQRKIVNHGQSFGRFWFLQSFAFFCGGLLSILCPQMICATEEIWRHHQPARYVGRRTHGGIRSWSVKYQGVFGHL
jgi:hypothetical protein